MNRKSLVLAVTLLALGLAARSASAANIVTNPNFANGGYAGSLAGWTTNNNFYGYGQWGAVYLGDHGDPNISDALTGCSGSLCITGSGVDVAELYQDLSTTPGDSYTLSFLYNAGPDASNELKVLFGSTVATDLTNITTGLFATYSYSGLVASSATTRLEFLGQTGSGDIALTEVSVVDNGPSIIPEPSSLVLLGTGALLFAAGFRRFRLA